MREYEVLLVDDDPFILRTVGPALESQGYHVTTAENGKEAVETMGRKDFDVVITDLVMNAVDGIAVLEKAKELNPETAVIILTGYADMESAIDALRSDADDYLVKPCEAEEIYFRLDRCVEKLELSRKMKLYEKILTVCCACKKIRDDAGKEPGAGHWISMEHYIWKKAKLGITSTYCPTCAQKAREDIDRS